jgi:DNA-binding transcriptional regulator YiaG
LQTAYDSADMDALKLTRMRHLAQTGAARAMREAAGLSLTEAAASARVNRVTIHRWEHGQRRPHGEAAIRYLELLEQLS